MEPARAAAVMVVKVLGRHVHRQQAALRSESRGRHKGSQGWLEGELVTSATITDLQ
jgi:hypothetical protein